MTGPGERTYTTEEAARRLGIPAGRIAEWKHRGRIVPAGYLRGRVPVYLLEELRPLADAWARRARRAATRRTKT